MQQATTQKGESDTYLRKVEVTFNTELDIPECYAPFLVLDFENDPKEKEKNDNDTNPKSNEDKDENDDTDENINKTKTKISFKKLKKMINKRENKYDKNIQFKITVKQSKRKKISTFLIWDKNANPFSKEELNQINNDTKKQFNVSSSKLIKQSDKTMILFSGRKGNELKSYLIEKYGILISNIELHDLKIVFPKKFKIKIIYDDDDDSLVQVIFKHKHFNEQMYTEFTNDFKKEMQNKWNYQLIEENELYVKKKETSFILKGENFDSIFDKFFVDTYKIKPDSIKKQRKFILANNYSKLNAYQKMKEIFSKIDNNDYFKEISETIRDTYKYEKSQLDKLMIFKNLHFDFVFKDDNDETYWTTEFNISDVFNIDGIKHVSEGDHAIIKYNLNNFIIIGTVRNVSNGQVTIIFHLKRDQIPPGCNDPNSFEANMVKDIEKYHLEDEFDFNDDSNCYDEDEIKKKEKEWKYTITFEPNNSMYQKCSLSLLVLNSIQSEIKDIIINPKFDVSMNRVNDIQIADPSFDLRGSEFLTENDKNNENIMNFLCMNATKSQKECLEMILRNRISLIQGPPGCGKTTSIEFFVYHLLNQDGGKFRHILLSAYSNQAVGNMVKFVAPVVKALGKKIVWIPKQSLNFQRRIEFENATEEEKYLSIYKILERCYSKQYCSIPEYKNYLALQEKMWKFTEEFDRRENAAKNHQNFEWNSQVKYFSRNDALQMKNFQLKLEEELVSESSVVCCTLLQSAKKSLLGFKFDYLIIDEATQVSQINSLIPLIHKPSKMILLGDHQQLEPIVPQKILRKHKFASKSLYGYLLSKNVNSEMLKTQFRMNPLIAEFPNQQFYDGKIESANKMDEITHIELDGVKTPIAFIDVKNGIEQRVYGKSFYNHQEAEIVCCILHNLKMNNISGEKVGVITPYFGQKELLNYMIQDMKYDGVKISSVDNFQGSERDFIILSLVRTKPNNDGLFGFVSNTNRINVSITRAKKGLTIVGNFNSYLSSFSYNSENQFLTNMCKFYQDHDAVFDSNSIHLIKHKIQIESKNPTKLVIENIITGKNLSNDQNIIEYIDDDNDDLNSENNDDNDFDKKEEEEEENDDNDEINDDDDNLNTDNNNENDFCDEEEEDEVNNDNENNHQ